MILLMRFEYRQCPLNWSSNNCDPLLFIGIYGYKSGNFLHEYIWIKISLAIFICFQNIEFYLISIKRKRKNSGSRIVTFVTSYHEIKIKIITIIIEEKSSNFLISWILTLLIWNSLQLRAFLSICKSWTLPYAVNHEVALAFSVVLAKLLLSVISTFLAPFMFRAVNLTLRMHCFQFELRLSEEVQTHDTSAALSAPKLFES